MISFEVDKRHKSGQKDMKESLPWAEGLPEMVFLFDKTGYAWGTASPSALWNSSVSKRYVAAAAELENKNQPQSETEMRSCRTEQTRVLENVVGSLC